MATKSGKILSKLSRLKRTMCISFVMCLCGSITVVQITLAGISTKMSNVKMELFTQHSFENRQKYKIVYEKLSSCNNSLIAADPKHSSIYYEEGKSEVHLGDYVRFKVDLFNGYGMPMVTGGDHLRARLYNDTIGAYTSGTVADHENGTYTLMFQALWTGLARLEVEVLYTKEVLAAVVRLRNTWNYRVMANFSNTHQVEKTNCTPDYKLSASYSKHSKVCNFSYWNKPIQWYCAMPSKRNLTCKHWVSIYRDWHNYTKGISECEKYLSQHRINHTIIPSKITLKIIPRPDEGRDNAPIAEPDIPCSSINFSKLWFMETPTGYFYNDTWHIIHCKGITHFDGECLRHKTLILWGDSTLWQWFEYIKLQIGDDDGTACSKVMISGDHHWQHTVKCFFQKINFTLYFTGHNIPISPFFSKNLPDLFKAISFEEIINSRKSDDFILVIHLFSHIQQYTFKHFANHYTEIMWSLKRIFKKGIKIKTFIKLPHTYHGHQDKKWMTRENDYVGFIQTDIIRKIFKGLYDKVIVLNQRDATTARRNLELHPPESIVQGMVHQLMSYTC